MAYKDGFKKDSVDKVVVKDIMVKVGDADFVVMPDIDARFKYEVPYEANDPYRLVFNHRVNEAGKDEKYLGFVFFDDGTWFRDDIGLPDMVSCTRFERGFKSFAAVLDGIGKLGFPVSASKDFDRISSFVTFLDRMPEVVADFEVRGEPFILDFRRRKAIKFYESHPDFRAPVSSGMSIEERKMRYYDWAAHYDHDSEDFVRDRYQEKADYWRAKMEGRGVTPEMEARCGPGHKLDATDEFIRYRHDLYIQAAKDAADYEVDDRYDPEEVLSPYRLKAWEEWNTRKLVRALESKPVTAEKSQDFEMSY